MKILILQITLLLEIAKYILGMQLGFKSKFKRWQFIPIGMLVYFLCISLNDFTIPEEYVLMYLTAYVLVILMNTARVWKRIVHFFFIFLVIAALDEVTTLSVRMLLSKYTSVELMSHIEYFSTSAASFAIVGSFSIFRNMNKWQKNDRIIHYIKDRIYVWITIMIVDLIFVTTVLNYLKKYTDNTSYQIFITLLCVLGYIGIIVVSIFLVLMRNSNLKLVEIVAAERSLSTMQANYYKILLEREEETRKYRHDTLNHLICINTLVKDKNLAAVSDYVNNMYNQLIKIKNKGYDVGNEIINIFINNYLLNLDENIEVNIIGKCVNDIDISDIDLCIIFSNLIQNAVEELNKSKQDNQFIKINILNGVEYVKIQIINSINEGVNKNRVLFHKNKKFDQRNHGHGLENVTNAMSRNNSEINIEVTENIFQVSLVLKYKKDHSRS